MLVERIECIEQRGGKAARPARALARDPARHAEGEQRRCGRNKRIAFDREECCVQRGGRAYLSNAMLRGKFALRACIINFRTTRADIDLTLEIVRQAAKEIEAEE